MLRRVHIQNELRKIVRECLPDSYGEPDWLSDGIRQAMVSATGAVAAVANLVRIHEELGARPVASEKKGK